MKIAIMGAGAMGCLYGAILSKAGEDVWLIETRADAVQAINNGGVMLSYVDGSQETIRVKATARAADAGSVELLVFLVKSSDTAAAARDAVPVLASDTYALTLQNGIGNAETIMKELGMDRVLYGMSLFGGSLKGPAHVYVESPPGSRVVVHMGDKKRRPMVQRVADIFNHAGIRTEISDDIERIIWTKLPLACGLGMLTALTRLTVGDLIAQEEGKDLLREITTECVEVANGKGIKLDLEETLRLLFFTGAESAAHISSMLGSVLEKKTTEIGSLNEAVAREAEKVGLSAPVNRVVSLLVRIIEKNYDRQLGVA